MMIKTSQATINLPCVVSADDYHEFALMKDAYRQLGLKVEVDEVAFHDMRYVAVVHQGTPDHFATLQELSKLYADLEEE